MEQNLLVQNFYYFIKILQNVYIVLLGLFIFELFIFGFLLKFSSSLFYLESILKSVLWKPFTTKTSYHGNATKTALEEFLLYFRKSLETGKGGGISEYF